MILFIECVIFCIAFTLMILPAQYRDPLKMIASYPPNVIKRVESLPQYADIIGKREKEHVAKKIFGVFFIAIVLAVVAYLSGCRDFCTTAIHVFVLFLVVNVYDMVVLDWGVFCHSKKLRIPGTEDMDADYKDYLFHAKGALIGTLLGVIVSLLAGMLVYIYVTIFL